MMSKIILRKVYKDCCFDGPETIMFKNMMKRIFHICSNLNEFIYIHEKSDVGADAVFILHSDITEYQRKEIFHNGKYYGYDLALINSSLHDILSNLFKLNDQEIERLIFEYLI